MIENKVFISYAREDIDCAIRINEDLNQQGISTWFDKIDILPGQRWKEEIRKAIKESSHFLVLLSSKSISKKGFVQSEINEAIEITGELPKSKIFVIPVRIDECKPEHEILNELHWVDLFPNYELGFYNILRVLSPLFDSFGYKIMNNDRLLLYVSSGGTCRCAMANCITRFYWNEKYKNLPLISMSVGNDGTSFKYMSQNAQIVTSKFIDDCQCSEHKSIKIDHNLVKRADLVLAMSMRLHNSLILKYPKHNNTIY